jgi:aerobic carbon-monoxide dehydrogenase large subunit
VLRKAAELLETAPEDLELHDGTVEVRGAPSRSLSLAEIASAAGQGGIGAGGGFTPPGVTFASGTHFAVVEVDPWTGAVAVLSYLVVHDCGRVINPSIVDGQVAGGVAQGIGGALLEELVYDEDGQLLTGSFMDYLLPRSSGLPPIQVHHIETPSARNPLGIKGVGEAGTIGPPAAIANAVEDALRPFGARVRRCPLPPHVVAGLIPDEALLGA